MHKDAAGFPRRNTGAMYPKNDILLTPTAPARHTREGFSMYSTRHAHTIRRFTLGVALAVLALVSVPTLVDQHAATSASPVLRQLAGESVMTLPEATVQESPAPAAFSDALAAAPAGAQCNMAAHSCSVPATEGDAALSAHETTVAWGVTKAARSANHNQRM